MDFVGWLLEKGRELYDPLIMRMYFATVVGRLGARTANAVPSIAVLPNKTPTVLAENKSRDKALLAYVTLEPSLNVAAVVFSASDNAGPTGQGVLIITTFPPANDDPGAIIRSVPADQTFVLKPSEQLYGTSAFGALRLTVSTEYF